MLKKNKKISDPHALHNAVKSIRNQVQVPKYSLPEEQMESAQAYNIIHNELMLDGNARLNMATFVTTWMEPEAEKLMAETFDKNMIDKDEYPQTAEIEERCINIVSKLFHAPDTGNAVGSSAIGSSEAVMLAGMAFKKKWKERREKAGLSTDKPNLVLGTNVQVVWEKFCRYWDVEPKYIPMRKGKYVITADEVINTIDENTIGVVAILGTTFTGEFEPIEEIHDALVENNTKTGWETPLHVDAASGGFVAPFIHPGLKWDFRLPLVKSINVSGHKYGLVYPGIGWVVWRDVSDLPKDLVFHVNYLGGDMPTFTLNFSRPGNQVIGQYYNFIRLGKQGYRQIMKDLQFIAMKISSEVEKLGYFELLSDGSTIPVFAFSVKDGLNFSVYDISSKLRERGWLVPAYTMPADTEDVAVLRVVVREGFNSDMATMLIHDIQKAAEHFIARGDREMRTSGSSFAH
ncbi:glutamate decarboxylase [Flammeovirga sp. EKP202]|uniref:glutamate decarboxylase n=1 Tax=Flammeovirga sp. EKP202 TaxID=2770592 RepID=UPI00165EE907|nr:glutamate decarboxylase [Flammeovirga sp. EKP202]MBD0400401.1 glutamate decarboxylase [Flammeovirga sp. EKP202]